MRDRFRLSQAMLAQGMTADEVRAAMGGAAPAATEAPIDDRSVGIGGELLYGTRRAGEDILSGAGKLAGDQLGMQPVEDVLTSLGEYVGPSEAQEQAQAEQAQQRSEEVAAGEKGPVRAFAEDAGDAIVQSMPQLGVTMAGAATGAQVGSIGGPIGALIGGVVGAAATSFPMLYSQALQTAKSKGLDPEDPKVQDTALKVSALQTLPDAVVPLRVLSKLGSGGRRAAEGLVMRSMAKRGVRDFVGDGLAEGVTEVAQQAIAEIAFDPELRQRLSEDDVRDLIPWVASTYGRDFALNFAAGLGAGGAAGGAAGAYHQRGVNAARKRDVEVLTAAADRAGVSPARLEKAASTPEEAKSLAEASRAVLDAERMRAAMQAYRDETPGDTGVAEAERAGRAADEAMDRLFPKLGGKTTAQIRADAEAAEKQRRQSAMTAARDLGFRPYDAVSTDDAERYVGNLRNAEAARAEAQQRLADAARPRQRIKAQNALNQAIRAEEQARDDVHRHVEGLGASDARKARMEWRAAQDEEPRRRPAIERQKELHFSNDLLSDDEVAERALDIMDRYAPGKLQSTKGLAGEIRALQRRRDLAKSPEEIDNLTQQILAKTSRMGKAPPIYTAAEEVLAGLPQPVVAAVRQRRMEAAAPVPAAPTAAVEPAEVEAPAAPTEAATALAPETGTAVAKAQSEEPAATEPESQARPSAPTKPATAAELAEAAAVALPEPTEKQKAAGNYRKGSVRIGGLDVAIETPKGGLRTGRSPSGETWSVKSPAHYGYIRRTLGADGGQVDAYVGGHTASRRVFVIDQVDPDTRAFDEHKVVLGVRSADEAMRIYNRGFSDQSGPRRQGALTEMNLKEFRTWLREGDQTRPVGTLPAAPSAPETPQAPAPEAVAPTTTEEAPPPVVTPKPPAPSVEAALPTPEERVDVDARAKRQGPRLDKQHPWFDRLDDTPGKMSPPGADDLVAERTRQSGYEHSIVMEPDGSVVSAGTNGHPNRVSYSEYVHERARTPGAGLIQTHGHPKSTFASGGDVGLLLARPGLAEVRVAGPDGLRQQIRVGPVGERIRAAGDPGSLLRQLITAVDDVQSFANRRLFAIGSVNPDLADAIASRGQARALADTGFVRLTTEHDPLVLSQEERALVGEINAYAREAFRKLADAVVGDAGRDRRGPDQPGGGPGAAAPAVGPGGVRPAGPVPARAAKPSRKATGSVIRDLFEGPAQGVGMAPSAFQRWFGDSKVVNPDGSPKVVYHGTDVDFPGFSKSEDIGFHFGSIAQANARIGASKSVIRDARKFGVGPHQTGRNVIPVYLSIQNPLRLDDMDSWATPDVLIALQRKGLLTKEEAYNAPIHIDREYVKSVLARHGYDGIVYRNDVEARGKAGDSWIALDPTQIKSVWNRGTWDPENPDIAMQSATLYAGKEDLQKFGIKPGKRYNTRVIAAALEARQREKYGLIDKKDRSPEALAKIAGWMAEEAALEAEISARGGNSAVGWYSTKYQAALDRLAEVYPELTDPEAAQWTAFASPEHARDIMTAMVAITSDGAQVASNWRQAARLYGSMRLSGRADPNVSKFTRPVTKALVGVVNELNDKHGAGFREHMLEHVLMRDVNAELRKMGKPAISKFTPDTQLPRSAIYLGAKLGSFYANLSGDEGYLTMDRWWSRTFNRYRGSLLTAPTKTGIERLRGLIAVDRGLDPAELSDDQVVVMSGDYKRSYEAKGFKNGTEIERAANTIWKAAYQELNDTPGGPRDREFMVAAARAARDQLAARGYPMTLADLQAVMWYYEKRLYGGLGTRAPTDVSFEEVAGDVADELLGRSRKTGPADETDVEGPDGARFRVASEARSEDLDEFLVGLPGEGGLDFAAGVDGVHVPPAGEAGADAPTTGERPGQGSGPDFEGTSAADGSPLPGRAPLAGLPASSPGPNRRVVEAASRYLAARGMPERRQAAYVRADPERGKRLADAFEEMADNIDAPGVREAYEALARETEDQYQAAIDSGLRVSMITRDMADPYPEGPRQVLEDIRRGHMWFFPTESGYGTLRDDELVRANPMLAPTRFKVGSHTMLVNDLFRVVHDFFGHGREGVGFGAAGEENTWQSHVRMFSPLAARAMTTETRGQNSWVNYGPYGEANRADPRNTVYADQKLGLLPEWASTEGVVDAPPPERQPSMLDAMNAEPIDTTSKRFKDWFNGSKVVNADGSPRAVYHGTTVDFSAFAIQRMGRGSTVLGNYEVPRSGAFFAENPAFSNTWANEPGGRMVPAYLSAKHPANLDELSDRLWEDLEAAGFNPRFTMHKKAWELFDDEDGEAFVKALQKAGYDSATFTEYTGEGDDEVGSKVWVVFEPGQVKSTFNRGSWNPENPDIAMGSDPIENAADLKEAFLSRPLDPNQFRRPGWYIITGTREELGAFDSPANVEANQRLREALGKYAIELQGRYQGVDQGPSFLADGPEYYALREAVEYGQESILTNRGLIYTDGRRVPAVHEATVVGDAAREQDFFSVMPDGEAVSIGLDFDRAVPAPVSASMTGEQKAQFDAWFEGSKVVDPQGKPLVVYHGSPGMRNSDLAEGFDTPTYFIDDPEGAASYAKGNMAGAPTPWSWIEDRSGMVVPVYLSIKNPYVVDAFEGDRLTNDGISVDDSVARKLKKQGYDGVIVKHYSDEDSFGTAYVAFEPSQIKSVWNRGSWNPENPDVAMGSDLVWPKYMQGPRAPGRAAYREALATAMRAPAVGKDWWSRFERNVINGFAPIRDLETSTRGKLGVGMDSAFKNAEIAINDSGRNEVLLFYGAGDLDEHGSFRPKAGTIGIRGMLDKLGSPQAIVDWQAYMAARRAGDLKARGFDVPLDAQDIADGLAKQSPLFDEVAADWKAFNDANVDLLVRTGRISRDLAKALKDDAVYIPFYRSDERIDGKPDLFSGDEIAAAARIGNAGGSRKLANRDPGIRRMRGGDKLKLDNLVDNMIRNSQAIVAAAMRNNAANLTFDLLKEAGWARTLPGRVQSARTGESVRRARPDPNALLMWRNGRETWVVPTEPAAEPVFVALAGLEPVRLQGIARWAANFASFFRQGITLNPAFMVRNLVRGMVSTGVLTSGANLRLTSNAFTGMVDSLRRGSGRQVFTAKSGMGDFRFGMHDIGLGQDDWMVEYGLARPTLGSRWRRVVERMEHVGTATELGDRIAAMNTMIANGVRPDEAAYQALTLVNYSRQGSNAVLKTMLPLIPFLNARIQGLARLGEGAVGKRGPLARRQAMVQLAINGALLTTASMLLWGWNNQDEERRRKYQAEPLHRRLNYHILYVGDSKVLIPKAFEIGAIFASVPEMAAEAAINKDTSELGEATRQTLLNTFSFNPIPAVMLPAVEAAANYSFFTGGPVVSQRLEGLLPRERVDERTSIPAKALANTWLGDWAGLSPVMAQHLLEGYGGMPMASLMATTDLVAGDLGLIPEKPDGAFGSVPVVSDVASKALGSMFREATGDPSSRYLGGFYEMKDAITQVYRSAKEARIAGDAARYHAILDQAPAGAEGVAQAYKTVNRIGARLTELNTAIRRVEADRKWSGAEKRRLLRPLVEARNRLTADAYRAIRRLEEQHGLKFAGAQ